MILQFVYIKWLWFELERKNLKVLRDDKAETQECPYRRAQEAGDSLAKLLVGEILLLESQSLWKMLWE